MTTAIDYAQWKVTLPVGKPGRPTEILRPVSSADGRYAPWFVADVLRRELLFRAHAGGVTTPRSEYPRSELRELERKSGKLAGWDSRRGRHTLLMNGRITHLPDAKPHLVPVQIHDGDGDVLQVRLEDRHLFVVADGDELTLDRDYELSTKLQVQVIAARGGIRVGYWHESYGRGPRRLWRSFPGISGDGWFWKAGCYLQSNMEHERHPGAYGEVGISHLRTTYQAAA